MLLVAVLALPLLGAIAVALLPREEVTQARHVGFFFSLVTFLVSLGLLGLFRAAEPGMQVEVDLPWIASIGARFHIGIDGISLWLVLLTTFLTPIVLLSTYRAVTTRVKEMMVAMLLLEVGMLGAFVALDLFLFYVFWELMLVPMYLIIGIWGHERRIYAAIKFVIFTMVGSLLMLVAILYMYVTHGRATGDYTFDYAILSEVVWSQGAQMWLFAAFALAFAIKVPMFPLHTWLPDAHVEAPTAGSVILAGVLLKLGTYGFLRFAIPMFPWAAASYAPLLSTLAVAGIVYGALVAYAQTDAKKLVAYSSVSHLGFVMLGILAMNGGGVTGGIFQMLSHGLSTGGLFLALGVLYERRHTHAMDAYGGVWKRMPVFGGIFMVVMLSSAGLPGLNGFVGEFLILINAFAHGGVSVADGDPVYFLVRPRLMAAVASLGVVFGAVYLLHLFQKLMFGPITNAKNALLEDLSPREVWTFVPLILLIFAMGIYPKPFLSRMEPAVDRFLATYQARFEASARHADGPPRRIADIMARVRPIDADIRLARLRAEAGHE